MIRSSRVLGDDPHVLGLSPLQIGNAVIDFSVFVVVLEACFVHFFSFFVLVLFKPVFSSLPGELQFCFVVLIRSTSKYFVCFCVVFSKNH